MLFAFLLSIIPVNKNYQANQSGTPIFITSNGIHADFTVPLSSDVFDWKNNLKLEDFGLKDTIPKYVSFGWGDKKFYLETPKWTDLTVYNACNALLWNSESAMHVTLWKGIPREGEKVKKIFLSKQQYETLVEHISKAFTKDEHGGFKLISVPGYSHKDRFFEASQKYNGINTCNYWVNKGLKKTGVKTSLWSPLDRGIFYHLD